MKMHDIIKTVTPFAAALVLVLLVGSPALGQFESENTSLYAWLDLDDLGGASTGNDCWGYVSPSGREYALMSIRNALVVVEITDPADPVIIESIPHTASLWGDVKTFGHYAYVVTDQNGDGIQVIDLADVDSGVVSLVRTVPQPDTSHNVAIDTASGYLYLAGPGFNGGRLVAYDLSVPDDPTIAGQVERERRDIFDLLVTS